MTKRILVPLAEGFEMIEALAVVDVFRRGGVVVDLAAVGDTLQVTSSHQVVVIADKLLQECKDESYDLIVLPGGIPGAENLKNSELLGELLKKQNEKKLLYGAICASPAVVLKHHGLLEGKNATCHPLFADRLESMDHAGKNVVFDQNCVTSRGAGTSIEFGLELLAILCGEEKKIEVAKQMALL
ncbi:DJ-1 family glyoxalase III [Desulforhopalus singaporensis]|uniref:4-methyl-5(B-hydroxyethyl)-thiazole monophosphate biosynthesis n=1 Tax=Desulforhopalus singaporensis TaxID=91360 RepID=A0A1H0JAW5_9BACT|nr:DJ-1 family glyoxalase III [Desulforhopalus singaporensis]SDO40663.1 4-methyl-5(b-hydroxyethyl)-thiazole monophosphate biosynthesis [Desulforhopalus singaporensis]